MHRAEIPFVIRAGRNYSHLSNSQGGWNKRGGGTKVVKSINVEGGIFWKKLVHNSAVDSFLNPRVFIEIAKLR